MRLPGGINEASMPNSTLYLWKRQGPDYLRGEFIRGWDDARGADTGRNVLSWQKGSYLIQESAENVDRVVQFSINDIGLLGWDKTEVNSDVVRARSAGCSAAHKLRNFVTQLWIA